jgi:hypothetical protein
LEKVSSWFKTIENSEGKFAGVSGNRGYSEKKIIGTTFKGVYVDATALERKKYKINGDKAEVFYTHILKKYKFPEFENENFLNESVVWFKIANDGYKIRWLNDIIYIGSYLPGGLTQNSDKIILKNYKGYTYCVKKTLDYKTGIRIKAENIYDYAKHSALAGKSGKEAMNEIGVNIVVLLFIMPAGLLHGKIKKLRKFLKR